MLTNTNPLTTEATEVEETDKMRTFTIDLPTVKGDWISFNDRASLSATEMINKLQWLLELKDNLR